MTMTIAALPVPLRVHDGGVVRVGDTRVSLDTVVYAHRDGATPEEIVDRIPPSISPMPVPLSATTNAIVRR